jgi:hypothetical protein
MVPVGELFEFDMKAFTQMPPYVLAAIRAMNCTVVVSEIRHHIGSHRQGRKIVHGYIVTDVAERLIRVFQTTDGPISERILSTVLPYIADRRGGQRAAVHSQAIEYRKPDQRTLPCLKSCEL